MAQKSIYRDIAERTDGDIYIGVVGPVRTCKSTFIKRFMDTLVIPNIESEADRRENEDAGNAREGNQRGLQRTYLYYSVTENTSPNLSLSG